MLLLLPLGYFAPSTARLDYDDEDLPEPWIPPEEYGFDSAVRQMDALKASPKPWAEVDEARALYNTCVHAYDDPRLSDHVGHAACLGLMDALRSLRNEAKATTPATPAAPVRKRWGFW